MSYKNSPKAAWEFMGWMGSEGGFEELTRHGFDPDEFFEGPLLRQVSALKEELEGFLDDLDSVLGKIEKLADTYEPEEDELA